LGHFISINAGVSFLWQPRHGIAETVENPLEDYLQEGRQEDEKCIIKNSKPPALPGVFD
jgi:hypothetical protein